MPTRRRYLCGAALAVGILCAGLLPGPYSAAASQACTATVGPGGNVAGAIASAPDGGTVCLSAGSYPHVQLSNVHHAEYVTVEPVPGATASVAGVDASGVSFLRFEGLRMTGGFNFRDAGAAVSHDLQILGNDIGNTTYGVVLYGNSAPVANVLIQGNAIHDLDFSGSSSGYAGGQGVTVYYGAGVTVAGNTFWANSWHYIQCGDCNGMSVDHNLFRGPSNEHAGAHLNIWEMWQGGHDDSFTNNVVRGAPGAPIANNAILWESGAGGGTPSDTYSNLTISNNLFVNEDESFTLQVYTATGLTITNNTIVGSTYGFWAGRIGPGGSPGRDYNISGNIVVQNREQSQDFSVDTCAAVCTFDDNVSSDGTAAQYGARHYVIWWTPRWADTTNYEPLGLPFAAGYRPDSGGAGGPGGPGTSPGGGAAAGGGSSAGHARLASAWGRVGRGRVITFRLRCASSSPCRGRFEITAPLLRRARARRARRLVIARGRYSIAPERVRAIAVRPTAAGLTLLRGRRRATTATVTLTASDGSVSAARLRLKPIRPS